MYYFFFGGGVVPPFLRCKYSFCSGVFAPSGIVLWCRRPGGGSCFLHRLRGRGLSGLIVVDYDILNTAHCQGGANAAWPLVILFSAKSLVIVSQLCYLASSFSCITFRERDLGARRPSTNKKLKDTPTILFSIHSYFFLGVGGMVAPWQNTLEKSKAQSGL